MKLEPDRTYAFPLFILFILLIAGLVFRNRYYFNRIKKIMDSKRTNESEFYAAIEEINNKSKGQFRIIDYVDVTFHGNAYKLFKGKFASIRVGGGYASSSTQFASNYICSLDGVSLANAKGMRDLLELSVENGSTAIFIIKNIRRLKKEIEKEALLNPMKDAHTSGG